MAAIKCRLSAPLGHSGEHVLLRCFIVGGILLLDLNKL